MVRGEFPVIVESEFGNGSACKCQGQRPGNAFGNERARGVSVSCAGAGEEKMVEEEVWYGPLG
jgi:hypothetical protein